jgi:nitrate/nitrite-specific signal transduction histidine kinase
VTVEDDGVGFEPLGLEPAGPRRGLGLIGIRERVSQLQGTVRLESTPGKGTRVTIELPARARAATLDGAGRIEMTHLSGPAPADVVAVDG